jgi:hypothetical protein
MGWMRPIAAPTFSRVALRLDSAGSGRPARRRRTGTCSRIPRRSQSAWRPVRTYQRQLFLPSWTASYVQSSCQLSRSDSNGLSDAISTGNREVPSGAHFPVTAVPPYAPRIFSGYVSYVAATTGASQVVPKRFSRVLRDVMEYPPPRRMVWRCRSRARSSRLHRVEVFASRHGTGRCGFRDDRRRAASRVRRFRSGSAPSDAPRSSRTRP